MFLSKVWIKLSELSRRPIRGICPVKAVSHWLHVGSTPSLGVRSHVVASLITQKMLARSPSETSTMSKTSPNEETTNSPGDVCKTCSQSVSLSSPCGLKATSHKQISSKMLLRPRRPAGHCAKRLEKSLLFVFSMSLATLRQPSFSPADVAKRPCDLQRLEVPAGQLVSSPVRYSLQSCTRPCLFQSSLGRGSNYCKQQKQFHDGFYVTKEI